MKNEPAFPRSIYSTNGPFASSEYSAGYGMSMRDYFAAKAMQGFAAMDDDCFSSVEKMAEMSYKWADAMLKAREA